jgi:glycosyltransferase involved in cell wall biosynthesis
VSRTGLEILYVGAAYGTASQRRRILGDLGHRPTHVRSGIPDPTEWRYSLHRAHGRLRLPGSQPRPFLDSFGANRALRRAVDGRRFDIVWIDRGLAIAPHTLRHLRRACPDAVLVAFSLDDMANPAHQSRRWLAGVPLYDLHVTSKSYNDAELRQMGARRVLVIDNGYDPEIHRPLELSDEDRARYGAGVGFVGHHEAERAEHVLALCRAGLDVRVEGPAWSSLRGAHPRLTIGAAYLDGLEYAKAVGATAINLGFLRKGNRDVQTTRSIEIPACGAFMLAERTDDHRRLFEEGREAEFFDSFDELLEKCRYYLAHPEERRAIAAAGRQRCLDDDYSYGARLRQVLAEVERIAGEARGV